MTGGVVWPLPRVHLCPGEREGQSQPGEPWSASSVPVSLNHGPSTCPLGWCPCQQGPGRIPLACASPTSKCLNLKRPEEKPGGVWQLHLGIAAGDTGVPLRSCEMLPQLTGGTWGGKGGGGGGAL